MDNFGRKYWAAKETGSPRLIAGFVIAGVLCLAIGLLTHRDFVVGMAVGVGVGVLVLLPSYLRRRKA